MPIEEEHFVALTDQRVPPRIVRRVAVEPQSKEAMSGETVSQGVCIVETRLPDGTVIRSKISAEALRRATTDDLYQAGQQVRVPEDQSGIAIFLRPADPDEAVYVDSPATDSGKRLADVAWIRRSDGSTGKWPYADISPAI